LPAGDYGLELAHLICVADGEKSGLLLIGSSFRNDIAGKKQNERDGFVRMGGLWSRVLARRRRSLANAPARQKANEHKQIIQSRP
jgi:hypothetical protein